ncbi:hypothetical protein AB0C02_12675 [Micromonospora sp. NPDC048999]|uniref:hypothetical protein n=1 Tax=Micromonospora sp. NPDC048999 TaxID=3155391 RepID=UPI0033F647ED
MSPASAGPPSSTWYTDSAPTRWSTTRTDLPEHRYDAVVDTADTRPLSRLRRVLSPKGILVLIDGEARGGKWSQGFDRKLRALALSPLRVAAGDAGDEGEHGEPWWR